MLGPNNVPLNGRRNQCVRAVELIASLTELLVGRFQFLVRMLQFFFESARSRHVPKNNFRANRFKHRIDEWCYLHIEIQVIAGSRRPFDVLDGHRAMLAPGLIEHRSEFDGAKRDLEILKRLPDVVRSQGEERSGSLVQENDCSTGIDDDLSRRVGLKRQLAQSIHENHFLGAVAAKPRERSRTVAQYVPRDLRKNAPFQIHGDERV